MNNLRIEAKKRPDGRTVLLRFNYTHKGRKYFHTGIVIPIQDFDGSGLEKPVKKSNPNNRHYNSIVITAVHGQQSRIFWSSSRLTKSRQ